ncbi:uncharacterized protein LOC107046259 isoform X2 [Diachasma alloeum]|uniref:uncharacterized protein LOC107046259 isoform X2 n=1 Tax=Diachasma alloeum TaxID=454923 RepID=UPI0007381F25|nr:uncharacterized protein LOC107046259 isoform X2 [Diachasma alloeum]
MSRKNLNELGTRRRRDILNQLMRDSRNEAEHSGRNEEILQNCSPNAEIDEGTLEGQSHAECRHNLQMEYDVLGEDQASPPELPGRELEENESSEDECEYWDAEYELNEQNEWSEQEDEENEQENRGCRENEEEFRRRQRENDDDEDFYDQRPLYRGAPLNVGESMLLILTLLLRHNLNYLCLADIMTVINLHCLQQNLKKNSLTKFQKYFSLNENEMKKHHYCATCLRPLTSANDVCPSCPKKKIAYFVEMPFLNQLEEMYKRDNFYDCLQWRLRRQRNAPDGISDIYDGSLYEEWMNNGFLSNPHNISFSWYTDGIPVFKSSKVGVWPLYLTINELPL